MRPLLLVALALLGASCSLGTGSTPENLVLISLKTSAPERLGCSGDPDARTPFWDRLGRQGAQFRMTAGDGTSTNRTLLTGAFDGPTLSESLAKIGLRSAAFTEPGIPDTSISRRGFDRCESWNSVELGTLPSTLRLMPRALAWVHSLPVGTPYFLFLRFEEPAALPADVDRELTRLLRDLEAERRLGRTMIVAAGDAEPVEDPSPWPLVIYGPLPFRSAGVDPREASLVDVFPTILDAFRHGPDYRIPGRPLQKGERSRRGGFRSR